ncbi:hypothetical protein TRVL_04011 [Trypanosoma vivax]|nr:hypothetical protein TRVL_04011 [Trypanosoma vivax]
MASKGEGGKCRSENQTRSIEVTVSSRKVETQKRRGQGSGSSRHVEKDGVTPHATQRMGGKGAGGKWERTHCANRREEKGDTAGFFGEDGQGRAGEHREGRKRNYTAAGTRGGDLHSLEQARRGQQDMRLWRVATGKKEWEGGCCGGELRSRWTRSRQY